MTLLAIVRTVSGAMLTAAAMSAIVGFDFWKRVLAGLSADGVIDPGTWLMARVLLVSLAGPGVILLLWKATLRVANSISEFLHSITPKQYVSGTLSLAAILRMTAIAAIPTRLYIDWGYYDKLAWSWATTGGFVDGALPTAYVPPGWPFLLSRLYLLFGHAPLVGCLANAVLGILTVCLAYRLIRSVWGEFHGRWAGLIAAVLPSQILFCNVLCSELLFTSLFLAALWVWVSNRNHPKPSLWNFLGAGVALGLATLTRGLTLLLPIVLLPTLGVRSKNAGRAVLSWLILTGGLVLTVAPWIARNYHVMGTASLSTNAGVNFYIGNNPASGMGFNEPDSTIILLNGPASEVHDDSVGFAAGWEYIREHPVAFLERGVLKVVYMVLIDMDVLSYELEQAATAEQVDRYVVLAIITQAAYLVLLLFATLGIVRFLWSRHFWNSGSWLLLLTIGYWLAVHFVFFGHGRFHFPIVPVMAGFAGLALFQRSPHEENSASELH